MIDDAWAVLDAVGAAQAVLVGLCTGAGYVVLMAAEAPERVLGICAINPGLQLSDPLPHKVEFDFDAPRESYDGWQKMNRHYWRQDWPDFARFFFAEMFPEPHSTKQIEDCVGWAMQTTPEAMILAGYSPPFPGDEAETVCRCASGALPGPRHHGLHRQVPEPAAQHPPRGDHGRRPRRHRGRRPPAAGEGSGEGEPAPAGLRAARGIGREAPRLPGRSPAGNPPRRYQPST